MHAKYTLVLLGLAIILAVRRIAIMVVQENSNGFFYAIKDEFKSVKRGFDYYVRKIPREETTSETNIEVNGKSSI